MEEVCKIFNLTFNIDDFYLKVEQMKEMQNYGMIFGSHTINHPVLSRLNKREQSYEILEGQIQLSQILDPEYKSFCIQFGGAHSFNKDTIQILKSSNFDFSFNVNHRLVLKNDFFKNKYSLPRFDCNLFKFGQSS